MQVERATKILYLKMYDLIFFLVHVKYSCFLLDYLKVVFYQFVCMKVI